MMCPWIGTTDSEWIHWRFATEDAAAIVMGLPAMAGVVAWWQQGAWFLMSTFCLQDPNNTPICACVFCAEQLETADRFARYLISMRHALAYEIEVFCLTTPPPAWSSVDDPDVDDFVNRISRRVADFVLDNTMVDPDLGSMPPTQKAPAAMANEDPDEQRDALRAVVKEQVSFLAKLESDILNGTEKRIPEAIERSWQALRTALGGSDGK